jgi:Kef-type K+ transport system membrane component KefB
LPRVTAYILVGLALGPHTPLLGFAEWCAAQVGCSISLAGNHVPEEHLAYLEPVGNFAIALVLFNMGCHFPLSRFRRITKRLLPISFGEMAVTMILVTCGLYLLGVFSSESGVNWQLAVLLGALALATAPATTVLVLKETRSEGPVTEFTTGLVVLNNLTSVIVFELLFVLVYATRGAEMSIVNEYLDLARNLAWCVCRTAGQFLLRNVAGNALARAVNRGDRAADGSVRTVARALPVDVFGDGYHGCFHVGSG